MTLVNEGWMNRGLSVACFVALLTLPVAAQGQWYYATNADNTINITGYSGPGGDLIIPDYITGLPVTSTGYRAFDSHTSLKSVTFGTNFTSIGVYSFYVCTGLTNLTFGNSVTSIGSYSFPGCINLTSLTIPDSVTNIGIYAFDECYGLTNVTIGNSLTIIPFSAFYLCTNLTSATIGTNVTSIEQSAFENCKKLASITIPGSVTNIGDGAFGYCPGLTNVTISSGVTSIRSVAFHDCTGLTSVTFPNSVATIGMYAFTHCHSLSNVYFTGNAPSMDSTVFYDTPATIYYLPWTTGWGATFGGLQTAPYGGWTDWQTYFFGSTTNAQAAPDADPLGKGMSNTNQFIAGLNPTNPASLFQIISVSRTLSVSNNASFSFIITWKAAGIRTNVVQAMTGSSYNPNAFQDIPGALIIIGTTGDTVANYVDQGGATNHPARFYRIRLGP